jgi:hypothetical protein
LILDTPPLKPTDGKSARSIQENVEFILQNNADPCPNAVSSATIYLPRNRESVMLRRPPTGVQRSERIDNAGIGRPFAEGFSFPFRTSLFPSKPKKYVCSADLAVGSAGLCL